MRTLVTALILTLPTIVALAAEEAAESAAEAAIGISNLILIVGIGAVVVVALVLGNRRSGSSGE